MENELKELMARAFRDGRRYGTVTENGAPVWSPDTHEAYRAAIAAWNARAGSPAIDAGEVERLVDACEHMLACKECPCFGVLADHKHCTECDAAYFHLSAAVTAAKGGR